MIPYNILRDNKPSLAIETFRPYREQLAANIEIKKQTLRTSGAWETELEKAARDLESWRQKSGREQVYTAESLALARLHQEEANMFYGDNSHFTRRELPMRDVIHQGCVGVDLSESGFRNLLIAEGKENRKFGIVELSARLLPVLTFTGSSDYFEVGIVPYGRKSREILGEKLEGVKSFVTAAVAEESARNLQHTFGVHYALAETSAAPRNDVPKSGKKPEIYICGLAGYKKYSEHHVIETPFREEFNAVARELMYGMLKSMYGVTK